MIFFIATPETCRGPGEPFFASNLSNPFVVGLFKIHYVDAGDVQIALAPPTRRPPASIQLRLRAPGSKLIRSVTVTEGTAEVSDDHDVLILRNLSAPIKIDVALK